MLDFLSNNRPTVTVMIQSKTAENAINTIRSAVYEGAEAFGLQICQLESEERKKYIRLGKRQTILYYKLQIRI